MELTRRELLTTFLGAPFAATACRREPPHPALDGSIVGQSASIGHVLRENRVLEVPADAWQDVGVLIVGAGIAGLSAARRLGRSGVTDLVMLEVESDAGGTSAFSKGEPVSYPWGAHYLPVPFKENSELIELLEEMRLTSGRDEYGSPVIQEQYLCRDPEERVFYKGRWYDGLYLHVGESAEDKRQLGEFQSYIDQWVNWRDAKGRRAFATPLARCSDDPHVTGLDRLSFADWLSQNSLTSERLLWYCDYACRDDYGLKLEQTSAWAGLFYFCSRVRQSGSESQPFITFPEGNGRFVEHLAKDASAYLGKSVLAASIRPTDEGADVVCLAGDQIRGYRAKKVVFASPLFTAPYIIRGFREDPPFAAQDFQHNAWFVANLFLRDRPKQGFPKDFPMAWDNVIYESPSLGYVLATHQNGLDYGPTILTYYYPMCHEPNGRTRLFNYEWRDLVDVCLSDLRRAHPDIDTLVTRIDIMRWGHAMVSPRPNFIWSGVREKAMEPFGNIHFAHTDLRGIALFEEAFYHGSRAADEVLTALGRRS